MRSSMCPKASTLELRGGRARPRDPRGSPRTSSTLGFWLFEFQSCADPKGAVRAIPRKVTIYQRAQVHGAQVCALFRCLTGGKEDLMKQGRQVDHIQCEQDRHCICIFVECDPKIQSVVTYLLPLTFAVLNPL